MEIFLARQPILKRNEEIFAYELLYRSNKQHNYSALNSDKATLDVLNTFIQIGFDELSEGKPCFINFTDNILKYEVPNYFRPEMLVIEILENVNFTNDLIDRCRRLKVKGYKIALDDFEMTGDEQYFEIIMRLANIVKIDIQKTPRSEQLRLFELFKPYNIELLAEKVETREEYEQCLRDGYKYFQGYFFCKPTIHSTKDLETHGSTILEVMVELSKPEPNIDKIADKIERDLSLSYKLLKLVNSPAFLGSNKIKSIKQAIVLVGLKELKKWIYLLYMREKSNQEHHIPNQLMKLSLVRARASELIAINTNRRYESSSYFLVGILSLIDTLLRQPLDKIMEKLPLDAVIKDTLLGVQTPNRDVLELVISIEKGEWSAMDQLSSKIGITKDTLNKLYIKAIKWASEVYEKSLP